MDINGAIEKAQKELVNLYKGCKISHIRVEEAIYIPANEQWKIAYSFVLSQGVWKHWDAFRGSKRSRECKVITLRGKDGQLTSLTNCTFRVAQYGRVARQEKQPGRAMHKRVRWWHTPISILQIVVVYPGAAAGFVTIVSTYFEATSNMSLTMEQRFILMAAFLGVVIGLFVVGRWWQNR